MTMTTSSSEQAMTSLIAWVDARNVLLERDFNTQMMLMRLLQSAIPDCSPTNRHQFFRALRGDVMGALEFFHAVLPGWNYMLESNDTAPLCRVNNPVSRGKPFFGTHTSTAVGTRGCVAFAMILATLRASLADLQGRRPVEVSAAEPIAEPIVEPAPVAKAEQEQPVLQPAALQAAAPLEVPPPEPEAVSAASFIASEQARSVPDTASPAKLVEAATPAPLPIMLIETLAAPRPRRGDYQPNALDELATIEHMMADRFPQHFPKAVEHA